MASGTVRLRKVSLDAQQRYYTAKGRGPGIPLTCSRYACQLAGCGLRRPDRRLTPSISALPVGLL